MTKHPFPLMSQQERPIKYVSYFDFQDSPVQRGYVTAATNKMMSVCDALRRLGHRVLIVSASQVTEPRFRLYRGRTVRRGDGLSLKLFPSWGGRNALLRQVRVVWTWLCLFLWLSCRTRRGETVLVYHSLGYFRTILWAKRLRGFRLVLEVEEIYQDVHRQKWGLDRVEHDMFRAADAFIFPTELLNRQLNPEGKPYVIICGTYTAEAQRAPRREDGLVHVVYAGTFDRKKGGAEAAVLSAAHLPENYHVHVLGFGGTDDTEHIKKLIADTASRSAARVTFEGLKKGEDYIRFIQQCHIGLSTQDPSAAFNATSFPSKILSYMANGLSVVSIDIPAVHESPVGNHITYYTSQTAQAIAEAILRAPLAEDNRAFIARLGEEFAKELPRVL